MDQRVKDMAEKWEMDNPVYCNVICTHDLVENANMSCPFRSGDGRIEYNPGITHGLTNSELELYFKAEIIRIILGHPYERKPSGCSNKSIAIASNLVLADNYDFSGIGLEKPEDYGLPGGECFEFYAHAIEEMTSEDDDEDEDDESAFDGNAPDGNKGSSDSSDSDWCDCGTSPDMNGTSSSNKSSEMENTSSNTDTEVYGEEIGVCGNGNPFNGDINSKDLSELWEENEEFSTLVEDMKELEEQKSLGSGGYSPSGSNLSSDTITPESSSTIDFRRILARFRESTNLSTPVLTRMKPNRRMGFERMGRKAKYKTNLLIGIDVSGSVDNETLEKFLSVTNKIFKYEIDKVDVVTFDTALGEVNTFKKAQREMKICGRGGTDFDPIVQFYDNHKEYLGLIVFTDGYADPPDKMKKRKPIVWVMDSKDDYNYAKTYLSESGLCCFVKDNTEK